MTSLAVTLRARTFRSLRRHRNFRIFFLGQLVSLAGSWMQNIALAWLVLELSGSPLAVGALAFARFLPFTVFGLAAGVVTDRIEPRRLVMITQAAALLVSVALAVVTLTGSATLPIVYGLAALGGLTLAFDAPGRQALTYEMVGPTSLPNAAAAYHPDWAGERRLAGQVESEQTGRGGRPARSNGRLLARSECEDPGNQRAESEPARRP